MTEDYKVLVSKRLLESPDARIHEQVCGYHGRGILMPRRFRPARECLEWRIRISAKGGNG